MSDVDGFDLLVECTGCANSQICLGISCMKAHIFP